MTQFTKLCKVAGDSLCNLESRRIYIPKKDPTKMRPLGIPAAHYRVYTAMWTYYLNMILQPLISGNQHGFVKGRNTATAMKQIYEEALTNKY